MDQQPNYLVMCLDSASLTTQWLLNFSLTVLCDRGGKVSLLVTDSIEIKTPGCHVITLDEIRLNSYSHVVFFSIKDIAIIAELFIKSNRFICLGDLAPKDGELNTDVLILEMDLRKNGVCSPFDEENVRGRTKPGMNLAQKIDISRLYEEISPRNILIDRNKKPRLVVDARNCSDQRMRILLSEFNFGKIDFWMLHDNEFMPSWLKPDMLFVGIPSNRSHEYFVGADCVVFLSAGDKLPELCIEAIKTGTALSVADKDDLSHLTDIIPAAEIEQLIPVYVNGLIDGGQKLSSSVKILNSYYKATVDDCKLELKRRLEVSLTGHDSDKYCLRPHGAVAKVLRGILGAEYANILEIAGSIGEFDGFSCIEGQAAKVITAVGWAFSSEGNQVQINAADMSSAIGSTKRVERKDVSKTFDLPTSARCGFECRFLVNLSSSDEKAGLELSVDGGKGFIISNENRSLSPIVRRGILGRKGPKEDLRAHLDSWNEVSGVSFLFTAERDCKSLKILSHGKETSKINFAWVGNGGEAYIVDTLIILQPHRPVHIKIDSVSIGHSVRIVGFFIEGGGCSQLFVNPVYI